MLVPVPRPLKRDELKHERWRRRIGRACSVSGKRIQEALLNEGRGFTAADTIRIGGWVSDGSLCRGEEKRTMRVSLNGRFKSIT